MKTKEEKEEDKYKCENEWHEEIELKRFEECPKCHSTAYHLIR